MLLTIFKDYALTQTQRDIKAIKRVEERLKSNTELDKKFCKKVNDVQAALFTSAYRYSQILKRYVDNYLGVELFERPFSQAVVISILQDKEFIAFLFETNLIRRVIDLNDNTNGQIKLRIYLAILIYDDYKKQKWCE